MTHLRFAFVVAAIAGCSAPNPQPAALPIRVIPISDTVEFHSQPYPMRESGPELKSPEFCHLGRDCMELDSRPFMPCLVNGEPCEGEGGFMQATPRMIFKSIESKDIGPLPDSSSKK